MRHSGRQRTIDANGLLGRNLEGVDQALDLPARVLPGRACTRQLQTRTSMFQQGPCVAGRPVNGSTDP